MKSYAPTRVVVATTRDGQVKFRSKGPGLLLPVNIFTFDDFGLFIDESLLMGGLVKSVTEVVLEGWEAMPKIEVARATSPFQPLYNAGTTGIYSQESQVTATQQPQTDTSLIFPRLHFVSESPSFRFQYSRHFYSTPPSSINSSTQ